METKDFLNRLHGYKQFTATGAAIGDSSRPISVQGYKALRCVVEGVGVGNTILVKGRLKDQASFSTLATLTSTSTGTTVDVSAVDEVYFDVTVYSASGTPALVVSGLWGYSNEVIGSGASGRVAYWSASNTLTSSANFTVSPANAAGSSNSLVIAHDDNTNTASNAYVEASVGGTAGGIPHVRLTIVGGGSSWHIADLNNNNDLFSIGVGTTLTTANSALVLSNSTSAPAMFLGGRAGSAANFLVAYSGNASLNGSFEISVRDSVDTGANIKMYQTSHATKAGDIEFRNGASIVMNYDISATQWSIFSGSTQMLTICATGVGVWDAGATSNAFEVRRDQAAQTRAIMAFNNSSSASAVAKASLKTNAGDFDMSVNSTAAGAQASLSAGSGFTGGLTIDSADAAGSVNLKVAGSNRVTVNNAGLVTFTGLHSIPDGANSAAGLSVFFTNDTDTGYYRIGTNRFAIVTNGRIQIDIDDGNISLANARNIQHIIFKEGTGNASSVKLAGSFTSGGELICYGSGHSTKAGLIGVTTTSQTTVGAAGAASALPLTPTGYALIEVNGTTRAFPYYAAS